MDNIFLEKPLKKEELDTVREFCGAQNPIVELVRTAIRYKIAELKDIGIIDVSLSSEQVATIVTANRAAHDKLVEIFDGLGFGVTEDLIIKRDSKKNFR